MFKTKKVEVIIMTEKKQTEKVSALGDSLVIGLPKEVITALNISKGEDLQVRVDPATGEVIYKKVAKKLPEGVRPEVAQAVNRAMHKYDDALRNLKDR
jgi:antitoxin MazE